MKSLPYYLRWVLLCHGISQYVCQHERQYTEWRFDGAEFLRCEFFVDNSFFPHKTKGVIGGDEMTIRVLLVMKRKMLSDALIGQHAGDSRFELVAARNYSTATLTAESFFPEVTVVEIPESGSWNSPEKCFAICDTIRQHCPNCKQVILCNEDDTASYNAVIQAKQANRIDDFLFYDNSAHYMFSKLEALIANDS